jgi:hypothetical protein
MRGMDYNAGLRGVLFEAKHYARMGPAVWLYGWLVLRETRESGGLGYVLGGKPVSYREIEEETGFSRRTLEGWMRILRRGGYVETSPAPSGVSVRITKAKKFAGRGNEGKSRQKGGDRDVEKLWKTRPDFVQSAVHFAEPPRGSAETPPELRVGSEGQGAASNAIARGISSGAIAREEKYASALPSVRCASKIIQPNFSDDENPSCWGSAKSGSAMQSDRASIWRRRRAREEEVTRELLVGLGPVVRR